MPEKGTSRREATSWERVWGIPLLHSCFGGLGVALWGEGGGSSMGDGGLALKQSLWCFSEWKFCFPV